MSLTTETVRKNRLIVLVPDCLAGNLDLAHKVFWMALRNQCNVLYLALVDDDEKMLSVTRCMTTMKAVTAGNRLVVNSKLAQTALWLKTLREVYRPGDRIVCHQEQSVKNGFLKTMPISEFLHNALDVPIISISGYYHPQRVQVSQWFRTFVAWLGFLLILLSFTALEIRLDYLFQDGLGKALLCILVIFEIGAIWAWNCITG